MSEANQPDESQLRKTVSATSQLVAVMAPEVASAPIAAWLAEAGFRTEVCASSKALLAVARGRAPDLLLLDTTHPNQEDWAGLVTELHRVGPRHLPVLVLLDKQADTWEQLFAELDLTAVEAVTDFLAKPFTRDELTAKVLSTLKYSTLQHELRISNSMLTELTHYLDNMVEAKVAELENVNRLRRFFAPQIVDAIVSDESGGFLREHRREITVVFLDLRNFTQFAERHPPQEVIRLVRDFHNAVGPVIFRYDGTLERFTGDGMMVFLGDPRPLPDHPFEAVKMALHIQFVMNTKRETWAAMGYEFGLGIGVATGEATMGTIGFEQRYDYAAIGTVTNLAARLCSRAAVGEILIAEETFARVKNRASVTNCGRLRLKGFSEPTVIYAVDGLHSGGPEVDD